jgi:hypothetical protein
MPPRPSRPASASRAGAGVQKTSRRLLRFARSASFPIAALLTLVGAAPDRPLLALDPAFFAEDDCLAPATAQAECHAATTVRRDEVTRPSASASLYLPPPIRDPLLQADLSRLIDFGPELAPPRYRQSSIAGIS